LKRECGDAPHDIHGRADYSDVSKDVFKAAPVSEALTRGGWKPAYPNGCSWALCLTHDVDDVAVPAIHSAVWIGSGLMRREAGTAITGLRSCLPGVRRSAYRNFDRIMEMEDKYGAKSTFFFLARPQDFHRRRYDVTHLGADVRRIASSGWEVGLHVAYEGYDDPSSVREQKHIIEDVVGEEVLGARNHYLRFRTPKSWRVASEAGLRYDSTLGFHERLGFRNGMCHPFVPQDCVRHEPVPVLEIPLAVMDAVFMEGLHTVGGVDACLAEMLGLVDEVAACGGVLTVLWHNDTFAAPWKRDLATVYEMLLTRCQDSGCWMTSAAGLYRWWAKHEV
jgi:peptidoglycan/xylan/chitin deacetylase (PgdA/CDA1 family)